MKQLYFIAFLLMLSVTTYAQSTFMPGYFVDNEGNRIECLIKNTDKNHSPANIEYKLTSDGETAIATITELREFEVYNTTQKYRRFEVNLDRSTTELDNLSGTSEPEFKKGVHLLKVLIEGELTLYVYKERGGLERFFVGSPNGEPEPLIYKKYYVAGSTVGENKTFYNQLLLLLSCDTLPFERISKTAYQAKPLIQLFEAYYQCKGLPYTDYSKLKKKGDLFFSLKGGVNSSALMLEQRIDNKTSPHSAVSNEFSNTISPVVSLEAEYVLPFYNKQWSIFLEPTYQYYKPEGDVAYDRWPEASRRVRDQGRVKANYSHISLPVGIRYSYLLSNSSRVFVNAALSFNKLISDTDMYESEGFEIFPWKDEQYFARPSYIIGIGYKHQNRISLEANYSINKTILHSSKPDRRTQFTGGWDIEMKSSFSVMIGYRIK